MTYVALLRGINVGGRVIKMADLQACFESLGLQDVSTLLQTGNVIFSSDLSPAELKTKIQQGLSQTFDYPAKVLIVSQNDLEAIVAANPFTAIPADYHQYVLFFENSSLVKDFVAEASALEDEAATDGSGVVYWKVQKGMTLKNPLTKLLAKPKYRDFHTNRNIRTLQKLLAKTRQK